MDATYRRLLGAALGAALLLAGCAGAPPPPPPEPVAPLPPVSRSPREVALERALGEFSGVPYRSGGTTPDGVDCSGLIQALYQRTGVRLPRTVADQYQAGTPVGREELRFGDVVFFNRYCQIRGRGPYLAGILSLGGRRRGVPQRHLPGRGPVHARLPPGRVYQPPGRRGLAGLVPRRPALFPRRQLTW